jgi:phosphodiesterase/alkaline phosphatase D-like protein
LAATLTNLQPATAYWWRVRAGDGTNWGTFVGPWKFTTAGLNAFNLTVPTNNANNVAYNVVNFNWTDNVGATGYHFMLDTDINFSNTPITYYPTASAQSSTNLTPGTTYYWKVRATNDGTNYGNWVGPWTFNTQAAPVGISEFNAQAMQVYPNPCSDYFELKVNTENIGQMAMIYNNNGQLIRAIMLTSNTTRITTEDFASGIYTVRVGVEAAKASPCAVKVQVVKNK